MRFLVALLCLLSTASLADQPSPPQQQPPPQRRVTNGPPSPEMMKHMLANPWVVEFIEMMGKWSRIGGHHGKNGGVLRAQSTGGGRAPVVPSWRAAHR
jgi:hypothetical protein